MLCDEKRSLNSDGLCERCEHLERYAKPQKCAECGELVCEGLFFGCLEGIKTESKKPTTMTRSQRIEFL
jgi:hypothetical protein